METFLTFLQLGFEHITDLNGYDHILFVLSLCAVYTIWDWKRVLILVTAFTVGHSITLALAALQILSFDQDLIEFLIPVSILITCLTNLFQQNGRNGQILQERKTLRYLFAAFFGLIHGMGFSTYLRSLLGKSSQIVNELLAFNIGLEIGQLLIVIASFVMSFLAIEIFKIKRTIWNLISSSFLAGMTFHLLLEKWYF
ncbi:MAG: HupE/UreJ family protein [Spirosomataceae bacterium]